MTQSDLTPKPSEIELVVEILQENGQAMHYKDLIEQALKRLDRPAEAEQLAAVLTQINLDARFSYAGRGEWGLKSWAPPPPSSRRLSADDAPDQASARDDKENKNDANKAFFASEDEDIEADDESSDGEESLDEERESPDDPGWTG